MKYVLDTNIAAAMLNRHEGVLARLASLPADEIGLSLVTVGELLFGARRSQRVEENLAKVEQLRQRFPILDVDSHVIERYATVRANLASRGRPKTDFDLLIACTALVHTAVLVTHDAGLQDGSIEGLVVEDWLAVNP